MRWLLATIVATITGHPRYFPEIQWSRNLWTHNIFRAIGYFFGERYGVRPSTGLYRDEYGSYRQVAFTFEAQLALFEVALRSAFKKYAPVVVLIPQLQLAGLAHGGVMPYRFAIAFDTSLQGTNNNSPVSFTATGANLAMFAQTLTDITATSNGNVTAMAYGATTLTLLSTNYRYPADRWNVNAVAGGISAGTANISETGSTFSNISALSYTGAASSQPDAQASSNNGGATTSSLSLSVSVATANSWLAASIYGGGSYTAGAGTTRRTNASASLMDSNGAVSTGTQTLVLNQANDFVAAGMVAIAPFAAAATVAPLRMRMGVGT